MAKQQTGKSVIDNPLDMGPKDGVSRSTTAVNKGAKPAEGIPHLRNQGYVDGGTEKISGIEDYSVKSPSAKGATPPGGAGRGDDTKNAVKPGNSLRPEVLQQLQIKREGVETATSEEFDSLVEGDDTLTDDFKLQAKTIFEAALQQHLEIEIARLEETYAERFDQAVGVLAEQVESFMDYSSAQWLEENRLAVEDGVRSQLNESFMAGLHNLFREHYVAVPEEKFEVFEAMVARLDDMEDKLNEQIEANVNLNEALLQAHREILVQEEARGLTQVQVDKLQRLSESISYAGDADKFSRQLQTLKESFIEGSSAPTTQNYITEDVVQRGPEYGTRMQSYLSALGVQ